MEAPEKVTESTVDTVLKNDIRLGILAEYDVTQGHTVMPTSPQQILAKFGEFKRYVKTGEFTMSTLEEDIYAKWGVTEALPAVKALAGAVEPEESVAEKEIYVSGFAMRD